MRYKDFGKTGIKLSAFGYGGGRFRGKSVDEGAELVRYAIECGVNHFDSNFGYVSSQEIFGLAVKGLKRDSFYMSTKNQPLFFKTKQEQLDEIKRSLEIMGLDYFDFYYMWNVKRLDEYERALIAENQFEALLDAKSEGLIRHICLSSHLAAEESIRIIKDGKIEGILLNLNILNFPYTIKAAETAKREGIGVGLMSPLYGGQIPQNEDKLRFLNMKNMTPTDAALRFAAGLWCADYAYIGFRSNEEIDRACEIADMNVSVDESEVSKIREIIGEGLGKACCGCGYCIPHCPKELPIAEYMTYYNLKYLFGASQEEFEKRLDFHKKWFMLAKRRADAKDCIRCGACERECTQHIPVMERIAEIAEIEERLGC